MMTRPARPTHFRAAALALFAALAATGLAMADDPQPPPPAAHPGFLHKLKVWWDDSVSFVDHTIRGTGGTVDDLHRKCAEGAAATAQDAMKGAVDVTKDAADTLLRLPNTRVVDMHEDCERAPNGAPDCGAAAGVACRARGFEGGQPLDVRTAEKCDTTQALRAGQVPARSICRIESWITRAVCQ
jgi:hypothetical protein